LGDQVRQQRQRQKAVRDGRAVGRFGLRALGVQVNPLVVASGFGKLIDALLRNFEPVAGRDFLADQGT
jgi:hypothetical protein